jgi:hypothetical protein
MASLFAGWTPEELAAYNARKEQEIADHDAGWDAGSPVDDSKSEAFRFGQMARIETDEPDTKHWWKR